MLYIIYTYITTNITIWLYTERARAVSEPKFPKKYTIILGFLRRHFSLCESKLRLYFLSPLRGGLKFTIFLGTFV